MTSVITVEEACILYTCMFVRARACLCRVNSLVGVRWRALLCRCILKKRKVQPGLFGRTLLYSMRTTTAVQHCGLTSWQQEHWVALWVTVMRGGRRRRPVYTCYTTQCNVPVYDQGLETFLYQPLGRQRQSGTCNAPAQSYRKPASRRRCQRQCSQYRPVIILSHRNVRTSA